MRATINIFTRLTWVAEFAWHKDLAEIDSAKYLYYNRISTRHKGLREGNCVENVSLCCLPGPFNSSGEPFFINNPNSVNPSCFASAGASPPPRQVALFLFMMNFTVLQKPKKICFEVSDHTSDLIFCLFIPRPGKGCVSP